MKGRIEEESYKWNHETRYFTFLKEPELFEMYPIIVSSINDKGQEVKSVAMSRYFGIRHDYYGAFYVFINQREDGNVRAFSKDVNYGLRIDNSLGFAALEITRPKWLEGKEREFARERMEFHSKNGSK